MDDLKQQAWVKFKRLHGVGEGEEIPKWMQKVKAELFPDEFAAHVAKRMISGETPRPKTDVAINIPVTEEDGTPPIGKKITGRVSIDGSAFSPARGCLAELGGGVYRYEVPESELDGDVVTYSFDCDDFNTMVQLDPKKIHA